MAGGYKAKSGVKYERKLGVQAVKELKADTNWTEDKILATVQQYESEFAVLDESNDVEFCKAMAVMRQQKPDLYRVFWWWRMAHEIASQPAEDEGDAKAETRYRTFMITQFLAPPFSDDWEDDRQTLKPGASPLITIEQIENGLDHKQIKRWAYIQHSRDVYTAEDEITDRDGLRKAGERKFLHIHVMVDIPGKVPVSTVARWFGVPAQYIDIMHGRGAFLDGVQYLVHETKKSMDQNKTHYDYDEVIASPGFDVERELKMLLENRIRLGKRAGEMSPADTMRLHVLLDGWTFKMCREDDPLTYAKISSQLPKLRLDYLRDQPPASNRLTVYVEGDSDSGKTNFCRLFAKERFSEYDEAYFEAGKDQRVTFEGYDGQPAIIFNEARPDVLIEAFGYDGLYAMIDPFPGKEAYQRKGSSVILTNRLTLLNSPIPWREFIQALIEPGKPAKQIYRRLQMVVVIHPEDYDVILSSGYLDRSREYNDYLEFKRIRGSIPRLLQVLSENAQEVVVHRLLREPMAKLKMLEDAFGDKITDPDEIPAEFDDYGMMPSPEELAKQELEMMERDAEASAYRSMEALAKFACWYWCYSREFESVRCQYPDIMINPQRQYDYLQEIPMDDIASAIRHYPDASEFTDFTPGHEQGFEYGFSEDMIRAYLVMMFGFNRPNRQKPSFMTDYEFTEYQHKYKSDLQDAEDALEKMAHDESMRQSWADMVHKVDAGAEDDLPFFIETPIKGVKYVRYNPNASIAERHADENGHVYDGADSTDRNY